MRISLLSRLLPLFLFLSLNSMTPAFADIVLPAPEKEWTFLVFINGNNNLDSYGASNINQMEKVGSTDGINVVVQWASLRRGTTQRMLVKKDAEPYKVTSPVLQEVKDLDMGDWRSLVDFVRWGHERYPAKRYFVTVWNHGNGWHLNDISWDDVSGNFMTTKQLGDALRESSAIIGRKIDLYASDACLMAMIEVANELSDSVNIFAGSEETEPGDGWPYTEFLTQWNANPAADAKEVARILSREYTKSYTSGSYSKQDVTFSAFDLAKMGAMQSAVKGLGDALLTTDANGRSKAISAASTTLHFTYSDYVDFGLYLNALEQKSVPNITPEVLSNARGAIQEFVIANNPTGRYAKASGVSIWIPTNKSTYSTYVDRYNALRFHIETAWGSALKFLLGS